MLTDIFADRYSKRVIWNQYTEVEARLLMQGYRIVAEQLMPYWTDGKVNEAAKKKWQAIHDTLSMELGLDALGKTWYSYQTNHMGKTHTMSGAFTVDTICKTFLTNPFLGNGNADRYIKERISFVELAFRQRDEELAELRVSRPALLAKALLQDQTKRPGPRLPGSQVDGLNAWHENMHKYFMASVDELNERFRRAGAPLNYHNGFIQIAGDELIQKTVEKPFWNAVADPIWKNVDIDMKEALDRRDANDRDPALYAAKALESAIKIISDKNGWTHGGEKGAHGYIDNLSSTKNGAFITAWERDGLKAFFTAVRNPLGHGPGGQKMPELTPAQTDWAVETCMSWIKTLVLRAQLGQ